MIGDVVDLLRCAHCGDSVSLEERTLACGRGHRFDVARQGHVNLLTTPAPINADTAEMVDARERYLARGLHDAVRDLLVEHSGPLVLDAGCGPGWYFAGLPESSRVIGLDLSVAAARRAARAHAHAGALVCDLRQDWPVVADSFDTVWCVFAPRAPDQAARVLRPDGTLLVVHPGPDHLGELVAAGVMIGQQPDKEAQVATRLGGRFELSWRGEHRMTVATDPAVIDEVIAMGPSAHHPARPSGPIPDRMTVSVVVQEFRLRDAE